jgi:siroheme synthase-like protein
METNLEKKEYFPFFLKTSGKQVLVVGGGKVATLRVKTLLQFKFNIEVVAPEVSDEIAALEAEGQIKVIRRRALAADITDHNNDYIVVATDDREANLNFAGAAKYTGKPVNVADNKDLCDFFFPAVVTNHELTAAVVGQGFDFQQVREAAQRVEEVL